MKTSFFHVEIHVRTVLKNIMYRATELHVSYTSNKRMLEACKLVSK